MFLGDCISDARGASRVLEQLDLRSVLGLKTRGELPILHDQKGTVRSNSGSGAIRRSLTIIRTHIHYHLLAGSSLVREDLQRGILEHRASEVCMSRA